MKSKKRLALALKRFLAKSKAIDKRLARLARLLALVLLALMLAGCGGKPNEKALKAAVEERAARYIAEMQRGEFIPEPFKLQFKNAELLGSEELRVKVEDIATGSAKWKYKATVSFVIASKTTRLWETHKEAWGYEGGKWQLIGDAP